MTDRADIDRKMETCFEEIRASRMAGIPILNEALSVKAIGGRSWNGHWLSVLITPWFINLMALPDEAGEEPVATGTKRIFAFPAGSFEFIAGWEQALGPFWMCSLFSPVLEFFDQAAAEATAVAALDAIFETGGETDASERDMAAMWRGEVPVHDNEADADSEIDASEDRAVPGDEPAAARALSRRAFLRGGVAVEERP